MNQYNFTYEVKEISENGKSMVLTYTCDGYDPVDVGARVPYGGETLDQIADMFAPTYWWNEQAAVHEPVTVGQTGQRVHELPAIGKDPMDGMTAEERVAYIREAKLNTLAEARYSKEELGVVVVSGNPISTDRATQAKLTALMEMESRGMFTSVEWKGADKNFFTMDATLLLQAVQAVTAEVQAFFVWERDMQLAINSATTEVELDAIVIS